jgi:hypothetical protein
MLHDGPWFAPDSAKFFPYKRRMSALTVQPNAAQSIRALLCRVLQDQGSLAGLEQGWLSLAMQTNGT